MPPDEPHVRPQTDALDALIQRAAARLCHAVGERPSDAMLFLGDRHPTFPALVICDPVLEPVDKVVWMVLGQSGRCTGASAVFPSYAEIARRANVASPSTISRAMAILRATRWLSLCARVRDPGGRFRGNVYALHDQPQALADTLHLDPGYLQFLRGSRTHPHARVRRVAEAVQASIDEDLGAGLDVLASTSPLQRRLEAVRAVYEGEDRRYFSFSATLLSRLTSVLADEETVPPHQKSNTVPAQLRILCPQNSKSVLCSSSRYIKTTTTTTTTPPRQKSKDDGALAALIYPERLDGNQRALAARSLASVPLEHRQGVLDELEGRIRAASKGARPVYDELRYLHRLCVAAHRGAFQPNLGLTVRAERERQQREAEARRRAAQEREQERQRRIRSPAGESPLAELRKTLGIRPTAGTRKR